MMKYLFLLMVFFFVMLFVSGCANVPPWAVEHGARIAGAILREYAPESVEIAQSIEAAVADTREHLEELNATPEVSDYRLFVERQLNQNTDLSDADKKAVLDKLFPAPADIKQASIGDPWAYEAYLGSVADNLREP